MNHTIIKYPGRTIWQEVQRGGLKSATFRRLFHNLTPDQKFDIRRDVLL